MAEIIRFVKTNQPDPVKQLVAAIGALERINEEAESQIRSGNARKERTIDLCVDVWQPLRALISHLDPKLTAKLRLNPLQ